MVLAASGCSVRGFEASSALIIMKKPLGISQRLLQFASRVCEVPLPDGSIVVVVIIVLVAAITEDDALDDPAVTVLDVMHANRGAGSEAGLNFGSGNHHAAAGFVNDARAVVVGHRAGRFGYNEVGGRIVSRDGATARHGGGFDDGLRR